MPTIRKIQSKKGVRYRAVVRIQGHHTSKTFPRKTDAKRWAQAEEERLRAAASMGVVGTPVSFDTLCSEYVNQWRGRDHSALQRVEFWRERFGKKKISDITPAMIRAALQEYAEGHALVPLKGGGTKVSGRKRAPATVNRMRATLSTLFTFAIKERGWLVDNPVRLVPARKDNGKRDRYLSEDERVRLLEAARAYDRYDRMYAAIVLAITTGMRRGEMLGLRWSDIDWQTRTAYLRQTKNGEPRKVPLPEPVISALRPFRGVGDALVFPSRYPWRPVSLEAHWKRVKQAAGIEDLRWHDLRHSAASFMINSGCTLEEVGQVLGHKSLQTTRRYAHLSDQRKREVLDRTFGAMRW